MPSYQKNRPSNTTSVQSNSASTRCKIEVSTPKHPPEPEKPQLKEYQPEEPAKVSNLRSSNGGNVVRIDDGETGLSARTIARRLATLSGFYRYLGARNLVAASPVPSGLSVRRAFSRQRPGRAAPLIRTPRTLPRIIDSADATRFLAALRTARDRAMILAMLLGGLRRCKVLGLELADIALADRRVTIT
jgi:integrase